MKQKQLQFEWNLLVLVTAALVLFGLVMVYSATSGSAALGNTNPLGYVERQVTYAIVGVALLVVVSRLRLDQIRALAPTLVVTALVLCLGVLAVGSRINGARRWIDVGPLVFQPSELAKLALVVWTAAYLSRHKPPRTLKELGRPIGLLVLVFAALVLVEPDLGTALTLLLVVGAILLVSGTRLPLLGSAYGLVFGLAAIAAWSVRDKNLSPTVAPVRLALISRIKEAEAIALGIPEAEQINEVSDDEARAFLESLHGVCTIPKDRSRWHLAELDVICLLKEHLLETPVAATTEDQRRALDAAIKLRLQAALGTHRPRPAAPATPHVPGQRVQPRRKRPKDKR